MTATSASATTVTDGTASLIGGALTATSASATTVTDGTASLIGGALTATSASATTVTDGTASLIGGALTATSATATTVTDGYTSLTGGSLISAYYITTNPSHTVALDNAGTTLYIEQIGSTIDNGSPSTNTVLGGSTGLRFCSGNAETTTTNTEFKRLNFFGGSRTVDKGLSGYAVGQYGLGSDGSGAAAAYRISTDNGSTPRRDLSLASDNLTSVIFYDGSEIGGTWNGNGAVWGPGTAISVSTASAFTGGIGASYYTLYDVIGALKSYGLLKD